MSNFRVSIVALPIGNVDDLSPRAKRALTGATRIICEDTRKVNDLLTRAGLTSAARIFPMPGDSENDIDWKQFLPEGNTSESVVLVSDAGTPIVNDPGASLVHYCHQHKIAVEAIPGPSAPVMAWQWSGGFGLPFLFAGFAPKAKSATAQALTDFFAQANRCRSFCYFETRHQVETSMEHLISRGWGDRKLFIAREMTKTHEELIAGTVEECRVLIDERIASGDGVGELTLILEGASRDQLQSAEVPHTPVTIDQLVELRNLRPRDAAKLIAKLTSHNIAETYDRLVASKSVHTFKKNSPEDL